MTDLIQQLLLIGGTGGLGGFFGWFWTRKKQAAEVTTTDIDNGAKVVELYKAAMDDLGARYELKYKHLEEMSKSIENLFANKERMLQQELELLRKQVALYKKMYDDKVREFNKYKKEHP
jgi:phage host-nuclease inhibitor protein Gam